jgi:hypothetical protein
MKILELELLSEVRVPHNRVSRYRSHFSVEKGDVLAIIPELLSFQVSFESGSVYFPFHVVRCWRAEVEEGKPTAPDCDHEGADCPHFPYSPKEVGKVKRGPRRS